jgi:hypothetical protein
MTCAPNSDGGPPRRTFKRSSGAAVAGPEGANAAPAKAVAIEKPPVTMAFYGHCEGSQLDGVAFPLGGIGAGMTCLEGRARYLTVLDEHPKEIHVLRPSGASARPRSSRWCRLPSPSMGPRNSFAPSMIRSISPTISARITTPHGRKVLSATNRRSDSQHDSFPQSLAPVGPRPPSARVCQANLAQPS